VSGLFFRHGVHLLPASVLITNCFPVSCTISSHLIWGQSAASFQCFCMLFV